MGEPLADGQIETVRRELLAGPQDLAPEWLSRGRVAVPFESPLELDDELAARVAVALGRVGGLAWGVTCESWPGYREPPGQVVALDVASIRGFHDDMMPVDMLLTSPSLQVAVLFGQDEYSLVGGARAAVETVLGMPMASAHARFAAYATEQAGAARHLGGVAARYAAART